MWGICDSTVRGWLGQGTPLASLELWHQPGLQVPIARGSLSGMVQERNLLMHCGERDLHGAPAALVKTQGKAV